MCARVHANFPLLPLSPQAGASGGVPRIELLFKFARYLVSQEVKIPLNFNQLTFSLPLLCSAINQPLRSCRISSGLWAISMNMTRYFHFQYFSTNCHCCQLRYHFRILIRGVSPHYFYTQTTLLESIANVFTSMGYHRKAGLFMHWAALNADRVATSVEDCYTVCTLCTCT